MKCGSIGLPGASRQSPPSNSESQELTAGFAMLETLAALTIVAIAFVGLFQANSLGLKTIGVASDAVHARLIAEALLIEASSGWTTRIISKEGQDGRFSWAVRVEDENAPWAVLQSKKGWKLSRVFVRVGWDKSRNIELKTLRLSPSKNEPAL